MGLLASTRASVCLQGLVGSWAELTPGQQREAFGAARVAVEAGAWDDLEEFLQIALQSAAATMDVVQA
jgi:hypothetical protein